MRTSIQRSTLLRVVSHVAILSVFAFSSRVAFAQTPPKAISIRDTPIYQPQVQVALKSFARPASILWKQQPLREGLANISRVYNVSIWLDRRLDASSEMTLNLSKDRIDQLLVDVATASNAQFGFLESVAYIGPASEVSQMQMAYWRAWYSYRKMKNAETKKANEDYVERLDCQPLTWQRFSTPQEVLGEIEEKWGITLDNKNLIPHDVWAQGDYPPLTLPGQLTLVLAGFGLTAEPIESPLRWRIVKPKASSKAMLSYPSSDWKTAQIEQFLERHANFEFKKESDLVLLQADPGVHYDLMISRIWSAIPKPKSRFATIRFTFEVNNIPAPEVIEGIATQLKLSTSCKIDRQNLKDKRISLKINQADLETLLKQLSEATGTTLQVVDESILNINPTP
jgi:hypothetical protein